MLKGDFKISQMAFEIFKQDGLTDLLKYGHGLKLF